MSQHIVRHEAARDAPGVPLVHAMLDQRVGVVFKSPGRALAAGNTRPVSRRPQRGPCSGSN